MNFSDIIIKPTITEKGTLERINNCYVFFVNTLATKIDIKNAVEKLFNVKVLRVNTINAKPKVRRLGRSIGKTSRAKKAYVRLLQGQKIDLVEKLG